MTQQIDNNDNNYDNDDNGDDIIYFDMDYNVMSDIALAHAALHAHNLNKDEDEKDDLDLKNFVFDDTIRACYANCSLDGDDHIFIPRLRGYHIVRYLTHGRRTQKLINKCNKARWIVRNGKVTKISHHSRGRINAKVIGDHGEHAVRIKFEKKVFTNGFRSTRDIRRAFCDCEAKTDNCSHIGAVLYSVVDNAPIQSDLKTAKYPQYEVCI